MIPGAAEVGQTARSFIDALKESGNPLSLALVVVVMMLVFLLYYSQTSTLEQRRETSALIIQWQKDTDKLMAGCVSQDVTKMVLENVQNVTQTMLGVAQKDIERMQQAIDREREANRALMERLLPRQQSFPNQPKPIEYLDCDPLGPYCSFP
jgi:hypothetical protein